MRACYRYIGHVGDVVWPCCVYLASRPMREKGNIRLEERAGTSSTRNVDPGDGCMAPHLFLFLLLVRVSREHRAHNYKNATFTQQALDDNNGWLNGCADGVCRSTAPTGKTRCYPPQRLQPVYHDGDMVLWCMFRLPLATLCGLQKPCLSALGVLRERHGSMSLLFVLYLLFPAPSLGRGRRQVQRGAQKGPCRIMSP